VLLVAACGDDSADGGGNQTGSSSVGTGSTSTSTLKIAGSPTSQVAPGTAFRFVPEVSNPDGLSLRFSATNLPGWASIDPASGVVSGTPAAGDVGVYTNIRITATGGSQSAISPSWTIRVDGSGTGAAVLSWLPPTENSDGSPLTDLAGYKVYWGRSPARLDNSVTLQGAGMTSYVVEQLHPSTWFFALTSYNSAGVESDYSNVATKIVR
jgi:hypothetical protein